MLVEKEDLGLSLGLIGSAASRFPLELDLMPCGVESRQWNGFFAASVIAERDSETLRVETRPLLQGIDVNRMPCTADHEEEAAVSSPNSTVSSASGKRSERDRDTEEIDIEKASCRGISDEEDGEGSRKKLRLSKEQSMILEESFKEHNTLNPKQKLALARQLNLRPRQVEVWFQNRRARTKLKQTEVDCEFLKRCCENLRDENQRLQKEVQELRALKLSPQLFMHQISPTTLTMCPSCERVAVSSSAHHIPHQPTRHPAISTPPWALPPLLAIGAIAPP